MADINSIEQVLKDINSTLNNITSNSNGVSGSSMQNFIDYTTVLGQIDSYTDTIQSNVKSIKGYMPNISNYLKDSAKYLKDIESHIKGFNNGNNSAQNTTGNTNFTNIGTDVHDILAEIKQFRIDYNKIQYNKTYSNLTKNQQKIEDQHRNLEYEEKKRQNERKLAELKLRKNPNDKDARETIARLEKEDKQLEKTLKKSKITRGEKVAKGFEIASKGITTIGKGGIDSSKMIDDGINKISQMGIAGGIAGSILSIIKMGFDSYGAQSKLGSQYARTVGGGKYGMDEFIQREANFVNRNSTWTNNYKPDEVFSALTSFAENTGRNGIHQTDANMKSMIDLKRMGIEGDTLNMFDTFGKSANEVDSYFTKLYSESGKRGLSFTKVSKAVKDNLKMAQTYTFASGVKGLMRMAETSTQLKFNMNEVAKMAEKVSTLEGAMKAGAGLSVLGGEFANFANPMQMMYEGLNDMEGLQKRMVNMFGDMAYFDKDKQEITVGAFDKQRMKAASEAMGVDYNEMLSLAMNNQRGKMVETQLGKGLDEDTANYIKNIAQIDKNGRAYVEISGKTKSVSELTNADKDMLAGESKKKDMGENAKIGDVYNSTRDMYDKLDQIMNFLSTKLGVWVAKIAGIRWGGKDEKTYWQSLNEEDKEALISKYGGRKATKAAIKMGAEDKNITKYFGSEENRTFFNENYQNRHGYYDPYSGQYYQDSLSKYVDDIKKGVYEGEKEAWNKKRKDEELEKATATLHDLGGINSRNGWTSMNWKKGEAILNDRAVKNLGINNVNAFNHGDFSSISNTGNALNTMKVAPTFTASASPQKLSFEPMNINLNGRFELTSNGKNKSINLDDLDKNELKKLVMDIVKSSTPQINKQLMTLRDKGYNMEKDPFRGSGGYA